MTQTSTLDPHSLPITETPQPESSVTVTVLGPSEATLQNILRFSRSYEVKSSALLKHVEIVKS